MTRHQGIRRGVEVKLANLPAAGARKLVREYVREIPSDLEGLPYLRLGNGVILVPPSHASEALRILRSRGCRVNVAGPVMPSQGRYQASNAYFLGQWQSYLSGSTDSWRTRLTAPKRRCP